MLVLLPPSETKRRGGDGPSLDLGALSFPSLNGIRADLVAALVALVGDPAAARRALGLSDRQDAERALNAALPDAPTLPALHRYTGVLYDALDYPSLSTGARRRADGSVLVASALFGLVRPTDPIPAYRLSGGTALPGVPALGRLWRPALKPLLAEAAQHDLVVDLRSTAYAALARVPGAVTVRVLTERPDGGYTVVSHHNKEAKGRLARALLSERARARNVAGVTYAARRAGLAADQTGESAITIVI